MEELPFTVTHEGCAAGELGTRRVKCQEQQQQRIEGVRAESKGGGSGLLSRG